MKPHLPNLCVSYAHAHWPEMVVEMGMAVEKAYFAIGTDPISQKG